MKRLLTFGAIVLSNVLTAAQGFEVATIKPNRQANDPGPRYSIRGRTFNAARASLIDLVKFAYGLHGSQLIAAPEWASSDRYDVEALSPGGGAPNERQLKGMLQALLSDRFQLAFHREEREMPAFVIVLGSGRPKLTPTQASPESLPVAAIGPGSFSGTNATITDLANALQGVAMDRPVVDQTGLRGRWDFTLEWTPDLSQFGGRALPVGRPDRQPPALSTAIQEQLGLKLESRRTTVEVLVIDRVARPSDN